MSHQEPERGGMGCPECGVRDGHDVTCSRVAGVSWRVTNHADEIKRLEAELIAEREKHETLAHAFESERDLRKQYEDQLAAERELYKELGEIGDAMVRGLNTQVIEARKLLSAVQPFCQAWAAFDLADEIKDFLDGRTKEPPPMHTKD